MNNKVMFSSAKEEWGTPPDFFAALDAEFHFTLDVCATPENARCRRYFFKEQDALAQSWAGEVCWMNPPYGRKVGKWVAKAASGEALVVVALLPSRTDTRWFHRHVLNKPGVEVRFLPGRITFVGAPDPAPFPSVVVVFRGETK